MRTLVRVVAVAIAASVAIFTPTTARCDDPPTYVFEGGGSMTGQPPGTVATGQPVKFAVIADEEVEASQLSDVVSTLTGSIEGINETLEERLEPEFLTLGIKKTRLEEIRNSYCRSALSLVATLPASAERDEFERRLDEACVAPANAPMNGLIPSFATGAASYHIVVTCRDRGTTRITLEQANNNPNAGYVEFVDNADCAERAFELRLQKAIAGAVDDWSTAYPMPQATRLATATARASYKTSKSALQAQLENNKKLRECLNKAKEEIDKKLRPNMTTAEELALLKEHAMAITSCTGTMTLEHAYTALLAARTGLVGANTTLKTIFDPLATTASGWVERWLWLTGGRPTLHPLAADTIGPLKRQLKADKEELAKLEAQVATLDKLTAAGVKIDNPANLIDAVATLGVTRARRDELTEHIADLNKKIAGAESARLRDTFLYDGTYFVTTNKLSPVRMQHHDALQQYVVMGKQLDEVPENERVVVVAENADPSSILKLVQTVTPIATDRTKFLDELRLTAGQAAAVTLPPDLGNLTDEEKQQAVVDAAASVATEYDSLARGVAFADLEITSPPALVRFVADNSPTRMTRAIPQNAPRVAPADIAYTITEKVGTEDKPVGTGGYRRNRLYRVRFKTGLLYSTLEKTNIATDATTKERTEEISQHGVDALFGVATYIGKRRDPRKIDSFSNGAWSLLTAMTVRDPTENLLVGLGYEPYGGVTLTIGGHIGRSERIRNEPGHPSTEDEWRARPFFAITFDVDFLKQLFTIKPTV
jgi:hypothetical protein